jgi:2-oxoglutarate ferredoxin oxidoreductase subunit alpha
MEKRLSKLQLITEQIPEQDQIKIEYEYISKNNSQTSIIILSWGSTKGSILDALENMVEEFKSTSFIYIQIKLLNPFPSKLLEKTIDDFRQKILTEENKMDSNSKTTIITIEMNYLAQLDILLRQNTTIKSDFNILKYNGRPISFSELYQSLVKIINNNNLEKRVVLENGV